MISEETMDKNGFYVGVREQAKRVLRLLDDFNSYWVPYTKVPKKIEILGDFEFQLRHGKPLTDKQLKLVSDYEKMMEEHGSVKWVYKKRVQS